jgi:hypothetical protein
LIAADVVVGGVVVEDVDVDVDVERDEGGHEDEDDVERVTVVVVVVVARAVVVVVVERVVVEAACGTDDRGSVVCSEPQWATICVQMEWIECRDVDERAV